MFVALRRGRTDCHTCSKFLRWSCFCPHHYPSFSIFWADRSSSQCSAFRLLLYTLSSPDNTPDFGMWYSCFFSSLSFSPSSSLLLVFFTHEIVWPPPAGDLMYGTTTLTVLCMPSTRYLFLRGRKMRKLYSKERYFPCLQGLH